MLHGLYRQSVELACFTTVIRDLIVLEMRAARNGTYLCSGSLLMVVSIKIVWRNVLGSTITYLI